MQNLIRTAILICLLIVIYNIMLSIYENQSTDLPQSQQKQMVTNSNNLQILTVKLIELNNLKEQFGDVVESTSTGVTTPISMAELRGILQTLGIRDDEFNNLNASIASYAQQIAQNNTIKEGDRKKMIDILSQIYAIKLNDSLNNLNAVAYNEYLKSKRQNIVFKP